MDRRNLIGLGAGLAAATAFVKAARADSVMPGDGTVLTDPRDVIMLWPGTPPGGENLRLPMNRTSNREPGFEPVDRYVQQVGGPSLTVFRPERPDGSAIISAPGGAYAREMVDFEGTDMARRFNPAGVTIFLLRYRLPGEGWARRADVPLQDAQRAVRLVRANAGRYGIDPGRVGIMGFSAGGHLAASLATRFAAKVYEPVDAADTQDARPSFSVLMYPVITMAEGTHKESRDNLLGPGASPDLIAAYSCEQNVPADAPPTFVCAAADDRAVPPMANALPMFAGLQRAGVPSELHLFEHGGHGFGISQAVGKPVAAWPDLLLRWGASHKFFTQA